MLTFLRLRLIRVHLKLGKSNLGILSQSKGEPIQFFFEIAPLCCTQLTPASVLLKDHSQIWWQMEGICPQRIFHAENQEDLGVFDDFSKDSCHGGRMLGGCRQTSRYGGKAAAAAESVMTTIRQTACIVNIVLQSISSESV